MPIVSVTLASSLRAGLPMASATFHLAFPVIDIPRTKEFYVDGLGCVAGRETPGSIILDLHGNQLVAHVTKEPLDQQNGIYPRHFGIVFEQLSEWQTLVQRVTEQGLNIYQEPKLRFSGKITEHHTIFLADPFQNLLEFKHYSHAESIFGARDFGQVGDTPAASS